MKIKSLLIGMLASIALVGCTNEDPIDNGTNEQQQEAVRMDAYMTLSIASSTNSSRAVNGGTTTGDNHGNPEHSGHENVGTADENKVNSILVCFYNTATGSTDGFCNIYNMTSESSVSSENTYNSYDTSFEKKADGTYDLTNPFALNSLGDYKVLVVLNPADAFKSKTANNAAGAKAIYDEIIKGNATSVAAIIGAGKNNFMMANRKEVTIKVTKENNDPAKAATAGEAIEVERVASKITFRPTAVSENYPDKGDLKNGNNLYTITEKKYDYEVEKADFWVLNADGVYNYLTDLYEAKEPNGAIYWVYFDGEGKQTRYTDTGVPHTGDLEGKSEVTKNIVKASEYTGTIVFVGTKVETGDTENYYVQLQRYALVNLNNKVYYVRHTSATPASATNENYWGTVSTTNYLIEPNTAAKSALTFDATNLVWPTGSTASTYFTNDFKTVTDAVVSGSNYDTYFKNLPGTADADAANKNVTPSDEPASGTDPEYSNVGGLLDYCLENSILAGNQNVLTSTGVIFEAQIYDKDGNIVPLMLEYQGSFYPSFIALVEATKEGDDITTSPFWMYTDEDYNQMDESTKAALATTLANSGVTLYRNGKCYYFSAEIKHYDDKASSKGVMEYAIMRNNIYSLAVNSVNSFGFSSINLASGIEGAQSSTETEKVYLTMEAKILPWVVRFNDIEF